MELDSLTVHDALSRYYRDNDLPADGGVESDWFHLHLGRLVLPLPNPQARKMALFYHDVNHVLTGYNTVLTDGEMLVSGYEIGCGCGRYWFAWLINLSGFGLGLLIYPRGLFRAFLRGRRAESVYRRPDRGALSAMTVGDLRRQLGVPDAVPGARVGDGAAFVLWALAAAALTLGPVIMLVALVL